MTFFTAWNSMHQRCKNDLNYTSKGITIDSRWNSFENFSEDMRNGWKPDLILDREDNNKGYNKENCRWVTKAESNRNKLGLKLSIEKAREIRQFYKSGMYQQKKLAEMYGVCKQTINLIIRERAWNE